MKISGQDAQGSLAPAEPVTGSYSAIFRKFRYGVFGQESLPKLKLEFVALACSPKNRADEGRAERLIGKSILIDLWLTQKPDNVQKIAHLIRATGASAIGDDNAKTLASVFELPETRRIFAEEVAGIPLTVQIAVAPSRNEGDRPRIYVNGFAKSRNPEKALEAAKELKIEIPDVADRWEDDDIPEGRRTRDSAPGNHKNPDQEDGFYDESELPF